jgi:tetratricopeptide (TPR) repeat protein
MSHKTCNLIVLLSLFAFLLNGCADTYTSTSPGRLPAPVPSRQEPVPQAPPTGKAAPDEISPAPTSSPATSAVQPRIFADREVKLDSADIEFVQNRLDEYEKKYASWLEISEMTQGSELGEELTSRETECMQRLQRILTGYSQLLENMRQGDAVPLDRFASVNPAKMQQLDIAFLESRCGELLATDIQSQAGKPEAEQAISFAAAQNVIASHMAQGNYEEALFDYGRLVHDFPDEVPSLTTRLNYVLALQYSGQLEAATQQLQELLRSDDLSMEPLRLQRETADLLLASGSIAGAETYYDTIISEHESLGAEKTWAEEQLGFLHTVDPDSAEMTAYLKLLREFQTHDYRIEAPRLNEAVNDFVREHAGSPVADSALRLKDFAEEQLQSWFSRQLAKVDSLIAEKKYAEANEILTNLTRYYLPADLQAIVQKTYYQAGQAEIQEMELQRRLHEMELTEQWDTATKLLDSEHYDSAISSFETLLGTEYDKQAQVKITEAANGAASQMRKEAASLFIRAGKTTDPEQKKKLLLASHELLTEILVKYPQTDLLDKVKQNIAILEVQIQRFDPALLEEIQQENPVETGVEPPTPQTMQIQ